MKPGFLFLILAAIAAGQTTEGNVVNAVTGAPVAGAFVSAPPMIGSDQVVVRTDVAGHFRLPAPVAANMPVQVVHAGFLRFQGSHPTVPGQTASVLRIELRPAAVISGKIEDEEGSPVEGAMVEAVRYRMVNGERKLQPVGMTQSDDLGQYRLTNLGAGRYWVQVSPGSAGGWDQRYVAAYFPSTSRPEDTGQIVLEDGQEHAGTDVRLKKSEGVTISGCVEMPAGAAASHGVLWLSLRADLDGVPEPHGGMRRPDGSFMIRHVSPGDYFLRADSGYQLKAGSLLAEQKLRVGDADQSGIVLKPHEVQAVDLAGTVLVEGGGDPPVMFISVRMPSSANFAVRSNKDGTFVLKDLLPGHYEMQIIPDIKMAEGVGVKSAGAGRAISARLGEQEVLRAGFDLDGPPAGPLRITVSSRAIEIEGKLLDAAGAPVFGVYLALASAGSADEGGSTTGTDGSFHLTPMQPGEYRIHLHDGRSDWGDPDYLQKHESDFPVLRVVDGANPPLMLRLPATK